MLKVPSMDHSAVLFRLWRGWHIPLLRHIGQNYKRSLALLYGCVGWRTWESWNPGGPFAQ